MKRTILFVLAALASFVAANGAADSGFGDIYRREQLRLFSSFDNTIARETRDALMHKFPAIKKADIELQTRLGGRKSNIGINVIGSFADAEDRAFGWHIRAYGAQGDARGANAGLFVRHTNDDALYGLHIFADYEDDDDYDDFLRFSAGGEIRHRRFSFAANYYAPITNDRIINSTVVAFSRRGYDAKVRINIPHIPYIKALKAAAEFYRFGGRSNTPKDSGLRYGLEAELFEGLRIAALYDKKEDEWGGDISFSRHIGEAPKRADDDTFAPDLFAAAGREYTQRITTAASVSARTQTVITTTMTVDMMTIAVTTTIAAITTEIITETEMIIPSRAASVQFTVRVDSPPNWLLITTISKLPVTLPPADTMRPFVLTIMRDLNQAFDGIAEPAIVRNANISPLIEGNYRFLNDGAGPWTITIVQGSEELTGGNSTTTITTTTTTTTDAMLTVSTITTDIMTTTTTMTTFAAIRITPPESTALESAVLIKLPANNTDYPPPPLSVPPPLLLSQQAQNAIKWAVDDNSRIIRPAHERLLVAVQAPRCRAYHIDRRSRCGLSGDKV